MKLQATTNTDGYKLGHSDMYADGTTKIYSNLTPRTDRIYRTKCTEFYNGKLVFFGAQGAIKEIVEMWNDSFFKVDKETVISRYTRRINAYLGDGVVSPERMSKLHDLGYLPLEIKTLNEGVGVHMGIPVITITNTQDEFFWLVNYLETILSNLTWKGSTNATIAAEYKAILKHYASLTGCYDEFGISIQAHDFSGRGLSGAEDSARSGASHLTQFIGTDTLGAIDYVEDYYNADGLVAISVPATEHAVTSSNILSIEKDLLAKAYQFESEEQALIYIEMEEACEPVRLIAEVMFVYRLVTNICPTGIVSNVSDTYDFWSMLSRGYKYLKEVILNRKDNVLGLAKVVVRPDSGCPVKVICGDIDADSEEERKGAIEVLWDVFGGTVNESGFKVLDRHIGLIYGDSITTQRTVEILQGLTDKGFASNNVVLGIGSYTYQCNTRDTFGFAVKATYSEISGVGIDIYKDPKTDSKKKSAKGLLSVSKDESGEYVLTDSCTYEQEKVGCLITRFKDGEFYNQMTLHDVRSNCTNQ